MESQHEQRVCTPLVVAELDHVVLAWAGRAAARSLREDIERGAYQLEWCSTAIHETVAVANRYEAMDLGLTDASLVALAARLQTTHIATLDERHFRTLKPPYGSETFTLFPTDPG